MLILAALLCGLAATQPTSPRLSDPRLAVQEALRSGKKVILVVQSDKEAQSEAYSDWYGYFTDFTKKIERNKEVKVISLTRASYLRLVDAPLIKETFGVLFLRSATQGLLYDGMILEPAVYPAAMGYLSDKPDEKALHQWGLVQANVRLK